MLFVLPATASPSLGAQKRHLVKLSPPPPVADFATAMAQPYLILPLHLLGCYNPSKWMHAYPEERSMQRVIYMRRTWPGRDQQGL